MALTDLRISYRMDTGKYPLWAKNHDGRSTSGLPKTGYTKGIPRTQYGLWLEDKTGKRSNYLRDLYYSKTKEIPSRDYFDHSVNTILLKEYIFWLENFILKFKPEVVTGIIGIK
jgi:hypothetical protein